MPTTTPGVIHSAQVAAASIVLPAAVSMTKVHSTVTTCTSKYRFSPVSFKEASQNSTCAMKREWFELVDAQEL